MFTDEEKNNNQENEQPENNLNDNDQTQEDNEKENLDNVENNDSSEDKKADDDGSDEYNNLENRYDGWQSTEAYYEQQRRERGEYEEKEEKKKDSAVAKKTIGWLVALCIMVSLIAGIGAGVLLRSVGDNKSTITTTVNDKNTTETKTTETNEGVVTETTKNPETTGATLVDIVTTVETGNALTPAQVFKKTSSSVVVINITTTTGSGAGSGVVISKDGYIITNYHVANESCTSINVTFYAKTKYTATYVLGDEVSDVALIKIEKNDCVPVEIADSSKVEMGDAAIVIGNALGNGISITSGIVSSINGTFVLNDIATPVIQVDAAINQGNSGGGLFNDNGQLIGIVNAKTGGTLVDGVGYAIPSNVVVNAMKDLQTYGYVTGRAKIGVVSTRSNTNSTEYYLYSYYGLFQVTSITEGGSADGSGIQPGDILYTLDDQKITTSNLKAVLAKYSVGDTVKLEVLRPTADISNYITKFGLSTTYDFTSYLNDCEIVEIEITFVEFNS